jgi:uncharacterized protein with GYD domain
MPLYMFETAYKDTAAKALISKPQDRVAAVEKACASLGGRLVSLYFAFGDYDVVTIVELPDNEAAAAFALGASAGGALSKFRTTVLLSTAEAVSSMKKAKKLAYAPPK